ncbi:MAG: hypothetical protein ABS57_06625 [Mesorhizobium sp. SCN 65-12]|nr:MAG: hypothetical protein ABS57_06625 [Mesorhizobium sp. SCN 65-12]
MTVTLNIGGKRIAVSDEFLKLSPEQQNATVDEIIGRIAPKVDPATNQPPGVPAYSPPGVEGYDPQSGTVKRYSELGSGLLGLTDTASFGFADEAAAGLGYGLDRITGGNTPYSEIARDIRQQQQDAYDENPKSYIAGMGAGGIGSGIGLAKSGLSLGVRAAEAGAPLYRVALGGLGDGAVLGGINGVGSGDGLEDRAIRGGLGAAAGAAVGFGAPYLVSGVSAGLNPIITAATSRFRPQVFADAALGEGLKRSGRSVDQITDALMAARAAGQDMYTVADAMGHAGGRQLSTVARTPSDARQGVVDALLRRQTGQGDRLASFLAEGFDAPDTAMQRAAALTANRSATAATNYEAARQSAGAVNLNGVVGEIDRLLGRDPILGETALSQGPLGARLAALRDQLQKGGEQLVDFDKVLNIKSDLFQQMQRNPQVANDMRPVYSQLDAALEDASSGYRWANDTFRQQSRAIDAVDAGRDAASSRTRAADNIDRFNAMTPEEQQAFRAGYVDPQIARVESASISPSTNKARVLMTEKTGQEYPAFAAPGRADLLGDRIAREQRMFETANAGLGGSKTADNLADAAEMAKFDPAVMTKLFSGRPVAAIMDAVTRLINEGRGLTPRVIERVGKALMETDPDAARAVLQAAEAQTKRSTARNTVINAILNSGGAATGGRISNTER